ncbi:14357_t:CDS:2 [Acaulospora colombiana]|uniref:14357_t:CDS:1 n=1 Tax=Acaulospora colombiana TaxID=27376 RepID=A0ACA9LMR3_9GLOM|nr:14357_t:CDS:2 [Acaulospora colombiana]
MGLCLSAEEKESRLRSYQIDKEIEEDSRRFKKECKILLLGSGESGKSTIVKQMKIIHQNGYTREELAQYRLTVYKNLIESAHSLVNAAKKFQLEFRMPENKVFADKILDYNTESDPAFQLSEEIVDAIDSIWHDPIIPEILNNQTHFYMMDSAPYEYDQKLLEESNQNRMEESLVLFESVINSRWFLRTSIILFLNKIDLFRQKLPRVPLENFFPEYSGGPDINKATKYILWRFTQTNRARLNIYPQ